MTKNADDINPILRLYGQSTLVIESDLTPPGDNLTAEWTLDQIRAWDKPVSEMTAADVDSLINFLFQSVENE
jgi:hypothetical protein